MVHSGVASTSFRSTRMNRQLRTFWTGGWQRTSLTSPGSVTWFRRSTPNSATGMPPSDPATSCAWISMRTGSSSYGATQFCPTSRSSRSRNQSASTNSHSKHCGGQSRAMEHRTHTLTEYQTTTDVALSEMEADWLHRHVKSLDVRPAWGSPGKYDLTAGSHVGTVSLPHLTILIRPKVPAERVLFLISYALDPAHWQDQTSSLDEQSDLVEGMAAMFGIALRRALAQGILQGYRSKQEALSSVRGRIRFD